MLPITLEMVKKKTTTTTNYCFFLRLCLLRISCRKRRRWHFRGPKFKNFLGEHAPRLPPPPGLGRLRLPSSFFLSMHLQKLTQVHFKNCYLQGGYNFHMKLFRRGRGMIHNTFLKTPFPLWDVINDRP